MTSTIRTNPSVILQTLSSPLLTYGSTLSPFVVQTRPLLQKDIVPFVQRNKVFGFWGNPDKRMIERCPIIPIKQHPVYFNGVNAGLLKDISDLCSANYALDSAMCCAELKIIVKKTLAKTCINVLQDPQCPCCVKRNFSISFLAWFSC